MVQLNLYKFVHGYSTGVCIQMIKFISGIRLRHVSKCAGLCFSLRGGGGGGVGGPPSRKYRSALGAILVPT